MLLRSRVDRAQVFLALRVAGACVVAGLWVLLLFLSWIADGLADFDAEPGESATPATLALVAMITAFAGGALMLLLRPRPLRTIYAISAVVLMILGAAPIVVLLAA